MEVDNSTAHTGNNSLKIIGIFATGLAYHTKVRHEFVPAENEKMFTVSFWAKVDETKGQSRKVDISVQSQNKEWPGFYNATITLDSTDWKKYTHKFFLKYWDTLDEVRVGLCVAQSDVDFWIDDFVFFEGVPEKVNPAGKKTLTWGKVKTQ